MEILRQVDSNIGRVAVKLVKYKSNYFWRRIDISKEDLKKLPKIKDRDREPDYLKNEYNVQRYYFKFYEEDLDVI